MVAPVLRPAALVVFGASGELLTKADCRDSAAGDTKRHQVILGGLCAFCAESDIVLLGTPSVAGAAGYRSGRARAASRRRTGDHEPTDHANSRRRDRRWQRRIQVG